jgi:hypothetical protein
VLLIAFHEPNWQTLELFLFIIVVLFDESHERMLDIVEWAQIEDISIEFLSDLDKLMAGLRSRPPTTGIVQGVND